MSGESLASVPVGDDECLARFVLTKRHVLKLGYGVKAEALLAYKHVELSVTRHRDLTEEEVWQLGWEVVAKRSLVEDRTIPLLGRADFLARAARNFTLDVVPDEPPRNHANVTGWPAEKSAQMSLAQELAAECRSIPMPEG